MHKCASGGLGERILTAFDVGSDFGFLKHGAVAIYGLLLRILACLAADFLLHFKHTL